MGITMLVGMRYKILKRKILIILDFKNYFFPTYLQPWARRLLARLNCRALNKPPPYNFLYIIRRPINRSKFIWSCFPQKVVKLVMLTFQLNSGKTVKNSFLQTLKFSIKNSTNKMILRQLSFESHQD